jgi:hypothetical protein
MAQPTNDWIADRRPTEADGDDDGDVRVRYRPDSEYCSYLDWRHVGAGVPWKHCVSWKPPAPEPTKPALAVGQRWRRRDGEVVTIYATSGDYCQPIGDYYQPISGFRAGKWSYDPDGTAPFPSGPRPEYDLIELISGPTPTPRKFKETPRRTVADFGHTIDAIDEDGVAWWMIVASDDDSELEWHQLLPLPAKEVTP